MSEKDYGFVRLPVQWIRDEGLKQFRGVGELGRSVTALKLYIAILAATRSDKTPPGPGRAKLSFDALEQRASVARAMIPEALEYLEPLVHTTRIRSGNIYEIIGWTQQPGQWVKLPSTYIVKNNVLSAFPSRSPASLSALKVYLYLLERRERFSVSAKVSYKKIHDKTGVSQNSIAGAISLLSGADLIRWHSSRQTDDPMNVGHNIYRILGLRAATATQLTSEQEGG